MSEPDFESLWSRIPEDWSVVKDSSDLLKELNREISRRHPLYGIDLVVFAMADYADDIALLMPDGGVVEVHLTWNKERDPEWPHVSGPMSLEEWLEFREEDRRFREGN